MIDNRASKTCSGILIMWTVLGMMISFGICFAYFSAVVASSQSSIIPNRKGAGNPGSILRVATYPSSTSSFTMEVDNASKTYLSGSNRSDIPNRLVILTFDDTLKSQFTMAKPILDKYDFKAISL